MIRFFFSLAVVVFLAGILSCDQSEDRPTTRVVSGEDREMNAAMAEARSTIQSFISQLIVPAPTQNSFSIKARFEQGDEVEHIWLDDPSYDGKQFTGTIGNDPELISSLKYGDTVHVSLDRVSDWMYVDGEILKGGYTIRVLVDKMGEEERRSFDQEFPYKLE